MTFCWVSRTLCDWVKPFLVPKKNLRMKELVPFLPKTLIHTGNEEMLKEGEKFPSDPCEGIALLFIPSLDLIQYL